MFIEAIVGLLYPARCAACGALTEGPGFCGDCGISVELRAGPSCPVCDVELQPVAGDRRCGACLKHPPPFERAMALFDYAGPVGDAIRRGKYRGHRDAFRTVVRLTGAALPIELRDDPPSCVAPIPLHPRRVRLRGFDPPLVLAHATARGLGCRLRARALRRLRDTPPQAGRSLTDRRLNVRGAFVAGRGIAGADLLLVDDVLTTGETVAEAARVARRAGAGRVRVLSAARVGRDP